MDLLWLFVATAANVFLLGVNSQLVRDQRVAMCFAVSWGISAAQFTFTRVISGTDDPTVAFFVSGWGGAIGICSSIYFYRWFHPRYSNWAAGNGWCK
ncbi:hypothetical protein [Rheinheimera aquimaris]|uniref:hypothetical protein n=1 Tax=Rheinheimera aquimaris TaxID=412437 RepID=UPI003A971567